MEKNIYADLEKTVDEMVNHYIDTKELPLEKYLPQLEEDFTNAGFRDESKEIKNILLVKLDNVGDFILSSAAIREFRKNFPDANITLVVNKNIFPMAEFCPHVNEVLRFDMPIDLTSVEELLKTISVFCRNNLWQRHFDMALDLRYFKHAKAHHIVMCYFSGARIRRGYIFGIEDMYSEPETYQNLNFSHLFHTQLCALHPPQIVADYQRDLFLLKAFGCKIEDTRLEIWYSEDDIKKANELLKDFALGKMKIIVGIGGSGMCQKYPVEKYLVAFKKILEQDAVFIITGGSSEEQDAKFLQENLPAESVLNLVELKTDLRVTAAVISQSDMYIGNDTGVMYFSAVFHLPVIYMSRCAKDRKKLFPDVPTVNEVFQPATTEYIVLQPEHQIDECATKPNFAGCSSAFSHCIAQIEPENIVGAFGAMKKFLQERNSK